MLTGGTVAVTAGGPVGAASVAVGTSGTASDDQTLQVQAWIDEMGRIFTKECPLRRCGPGQVWSCWRACRAVRVAG
jgi:hypothetical protein